MEPALLLENVSKHYSGHTAVDGLSMAVRPGSIHGLLGPNGAGKSTSLRMIMNILLRDGGRLLVLGRDPERDRGVLREVGYLPEERGLYKRMTVMQTVVFFGRLKGLDRGECQRRGGEWLERLGLAEWSDERVEALSKGMQQKVQFIATVLHGPSLLILDEPQSGLDPVNQEVLAETIRGARAEGKTVVLSTHNMAQAEELCDEVTLIAEGRKILEGGVREVRRSHRSNRYRLVLEDGTGAGAGRGEDPRHGAHADPGPGDSPVRRSGLVRSAERRGEHDWTVELMPGRSGEDLLRAALDERLSLTRFEHVEPTLHEIFIQHVGAAAARAGRREATYA
jgi:ABC-2 type transport system ATP-binding protein